MAVLADAMQAPVAAAATRHPQALIAALAAECAKLQGVYEPFQSLLFENGPQLASLDWNAAARNANVPDIKTFSSCLATKQTLTAVKADMAVAAKLGFKSTPVMLINGNVVMGTQSKAELEKAISTGLTSR